MSDGDESEQELEFDDNLFSETIPKPTSKPVNCSDFRKEDMLCRNEGLIGVPGASLGDTCDKSANSFNRKKKKKNKKKKKEKHHKRHRHDHDIIAGVDDARKVEWMEEALKFKRKKKKKKHDHDFVEVGDGSDADARSKLVGESDFGQQPDSGPDRQISSPRKTSLPSGSDKSSPQSKITFLTRDEDSANKDLDGELDIGPKFHVNQRVLCIDAQQQQIQQQNGLKLNQQKEVREEGENTTNAANIKLSTEDANDDKPPLFEATVRKSALRYVDASTQKVLPEIKYSSSKKGGRQRNNHHHHHHQHQEQQSIENGVKQWCHLIHFKGWNSRWDRWMVESEIFPDTVEYRTRVTPISGKVTTVAGQSGLSTATKKKKGKVERRGRDDDGSANQKGGHGEGESSANYNYDKIVKACELPFTLKTIMLDDQDKITKNVYPSPSFTSGNPHSTRDDHTGDITSDRKRGISMLHVLPSAMSILSIMAQFVQVMKRGDLEEFEKRQNEFDEWKKKQAEENVPSTNEHDNRIDDPLTTEEIYSTKIDATNAKKGKKHELQPKDKKRDKKSKESKPTAPSKECFKLKKKKRREFAVSVLELFDASLPLFLLYTRERSQFVKLMSEADGKNKNDGKLNDGAKSENDQAKRPCQMYGAEFLLRLIVRMPYIVSQFDSSVPSALASKNPSKSLSKTIEKEPGTIPDNPNNAPSTSLLESDELSADFSEFLMELVVYLQRNCDSCFKRKYTIAERF